MWEGEGDVQVSCQSQTRWTVLKCLLSVPEVTYVSLVHALGFSRLTTRPCA